ncbi:acetylcholinesterase [Cadophora sp. DSE1049]|nr:acetylcholinesterase [Cadophora sp. DSE1049]
MMLVLQEAGPKTLPVVDLGYVVHRAAEYNEEGGFYNFSNIRYAAPPLGDLRFKAPVSPATNRSAVQDGLDARICPQGRPSWMTKSFGWVFPYIVNGTQPNISYSLTSPFNGSVPATRHPAESEDCLLLDVYVPHRVFRSAGQGRGAPVIVFIHGGGFVEGFKTENAPNGLLSRSQTNSSEGAIFVAMNYRLGAFGFLSGPTLGADGIANAGLYDQRMALEWVQQNIHLFGGDKDRVTVLGASAGSGSVIHQMTAFGGCAAPPFQQAIPQSPAWFRYPTIFQQEETFKAFLEVANTSSLAELRKLPTGLLIGANALQIARSPYSFFTYGPTVDGSFVTEDPLALLSNNQYHKSMKVMVGHNTNEGLGFAPPSTDDDRYYDLVRSAYPYADQSVIDYIVTRLYPPIFNGSMPYRDQVSRAALTVTESTFTCKSFAVGRAFNASFGYVIDVAPALHGSENSYIFYNPARKSTNQTLAYSLMDYVINFAAHGVPSSAVDGLPTYPLYGKTGAIVKFNATNISEGKDQAANERCRWWQLGLYR